MRSKRKEAGSGAHFQSASQVAPWNGTFCPVLVHAPFGGGLVGRGVGVRVGVGVQIAPLTLQGVGVGVQGTGPPMQAVAVGVGVQIAPLTLQGVAVAVGTSECVGVRVGVRVTVGVGVQIAPIAPHGVAVAVGTSECVGVRVGVGVQGPAAPRQIVAVGVGVQIAPTAPHGVGVAVDVGVTSMSTHDSLLGESTVSLGLLTVAQLVTAPDSATTLPVMVIFCSGPRGTGGGQVQLTVAPGFGGVTEQFHAVPPWATLRICSQGSGPSDTLVTP
jgi:hypothetical protein